MKFTHKLVFILFGLSSFVQAEVISVTGFKALPQEKLNWCWAASIQSIFLTRGLQVSQKNIVSAAYGTPTNKTAPGFDGTLDAINRVSLSANGNKWEVRATAGKSFPNANWLFSKLERNEPVMIWYQDEYSNHSIVINAGRYTRDAWGNVQWQQIFAYDPWLDQNMTISAANIPRYVYGSFDITLDAKTPENEVEAAAESSSQRTPYSYQIPEWMK